MQSEGTYGGTYGFETEPSPLRLVLATTPSRFLNIFSRFFF